MTHHISFIPKILICFDRIFRIAALSSVLYFQQNMLLTAALQHHVDSLPSLSYYSKILRFLLL